MEELADIFRQTLLRGVIPALQKYLLVFSNSFIELKEVEMKMTISLARSVYLSVAYGFFGDVGNSAISGS